MKIRFITIGKLKAKAGFKELDAFYRERIRPYCRVEIVELKEKGDIESETALIKNAVTEGSFVVALREEGANLNSVEFSTLLKNKFETHGEICFVIGGAYGYNHINEDISVSIAPWTLPHQLARIVLLEQIYRSFSIMKGSGYHHS
jgi:23S rRNA (pseudouridine1915-N3)-methyltransferase